MKKNPVKKKKFLSLTELEKTWWWKWEEIRRDGVRGVSWDCVTKEAARNYELMRRAPGGEKFMNSYLRLNSHEKVFVHGLWCNWPEHVYRYAMGKSEFNEKGWTAVLGNPPVQWNLKLADNILLAEFRKQIAGERAIQGIKAEHHLKGKKNNPNSWNYIELLDRNNNGFGSSFSDGERGMASKGNRMAGQFLIVFTASLAEVIEEARAAGDIITFSTPRKTLSAMEALETLDDDDEFVQSVHFFGFQIRLS